MGATTVVEKLVHFAEEDGTVLYRLKLHKCTTPASVVAAFTEVIRDVAEDLEEDDHDLESLLMEFVTDLDKNEEFVLGTALLHLLEDSR